MRTTTMRMMMSNIDLLVDCDIEYSDDIGNRMTVLIALRGFEYVEDSDMDNRIFYYSDCETEEELREYHSTFGGGEWRILQVWD